MRETEKYGRTYQSERNGDFYDFKPISPTPNSLFKYYNVNEHSIQSLVNSEFYCSSPSDFNDLFEFNEHMLDFSGFGSKEELLRKFSEIIKRFNNIQENIPSNLSFEETVEKLRPNILRIHFPFFGIVCLCKNYKNDLMWGYYGDNKGFQVEFDPSLLPYNFKGPYKVEYPERLEKIDLLKDPSELAFIILYVYPHHCT